MSTLRNLIYSAEEKKTAIGHFNFSNLEGLWAIMRAAVALKAPVILGLSEGERSFVGVRQAVALVGAMREEFAGVAEPGRPYPVFLNADHSYSFERVKEVIDFGFDAVIFDGAKLPLEENIKITKKCVDYARSVKSEILVEGEIGYIGESSKLLDAIPEGAGATEEFLTKPEEIERFVKETGVDFVAPAVGNIHGMLRHGGDPALDILRIKELRRVAGIPLVLHGGSGISEADFRAAIEAGMSIVHVNTELRVAYRKALTLSLQEETDEIAPYKLLRGALKSMQQVVEEKIRVFNNL